jgi:hypothetical protein
MSADRVELSLHEHWWQLLTRHRFRILLILLLALLAGAPLLLDAGLSAGWFDGFLSVILLAVILSLCAEPHQRLFALVFGIPTILVTISGHALAGSASDATLFVAQLCQIIFLFGAAGLIVRSLFIADNLSFDSVFGAICGYLFLGLGWAPSATL